MERVKPGWDNWKKNQQLLKEIKNTRDVETANVLAVHALTMVAQWSEMGENLLDIATKAVKWLDRAAKQFGVRPGY
jgi:hypothetical protein